MARRLPDSREYEAILNGIFRTLYTELKCSIEKGDSWRDYWRLRAETVADWKLSYMPLADISPLE